MDPSLTQTVSREYAAEGDDAGARELPRLVVALDCRQPLVTATRLALTGIDDVVIGRGPRRASTQHDGALHVSIADREASRRHVRLRRRGGEWELADLESKNGTHLNGEVVSSATLADGDVIEVGLTMLVYREDGGPAGTVTDRELPRDGGPVAFRTVHLGLEHAFASLTKVAAAPVPVLIRGETGTGKELVASAVHAVSQRRGPFVAINCGALPRNLIESELFGYKRGAFSGAKDDRDGLVRKADGGTLFLDEIAELPEESQVALLRVLQEGEVRPVGSSDAMHVDVRVVAATHQDLAARIDAGRFRQDLYARLAGFEVSLPPLRERREDLGTLIAAILPKVAANPERITLQRQAARALLRYPWPNNVRELEQALRTAVVLAESGEIRLEHLPDAIRTYVPPSAATLKPEDRALRERLVEILRESGGNVTAAGRAMGKAPIQIRRWCRRLAIDVATFRR